MTTLLTTAMTLTTTSTTTVRYYDYYATTMAVGRPEAHDDDDEEEDLKSHLSICRKLQNLYVCSCGQTDGHLFTGFHICTYEMCTKYTQHIYESKCMYVCMYICIVSSRQ